MVNSGLGWWKFEAKRRRFLVFSPAAPISGLFFDGSRDLIGPFARALLNRYPIAGNQSMWGDQQRRYQCFHRGARSSRLVFIHYRHTGIPSGL